VSQLELYRIDPPNPAGLPTYQLRHEGTFLGPQILREELGQLIGAWVQEADIPTKLSALAGYEQLQTYHQSSALWGFGTKGLPFFEKRWEQIQQQRGIARLGWLTAAFPRLLELCAGKEARNRRLKDLLTKSQAGRMRIQDAHVALLDKRRELEQLLQTRDAELATYMAMAAQTATSRCEDEDCPCADHELDLTEEASHG
jgi:hypothetical protein